MTFSPKNTDTAHASRNDNDSFFKSRVQTKLAIGKPGDRYEQEADNTADKVVSKLKSSGEAASAQPSFFAAKPNIQQKPQETVQQKENEGQQEEEIQQKPLSESITPIVQTSLLEEPQPVQTKCADCEAKEKEGGTPVQMKCDKCSGEEEKTTVQTKCAECDAKEKAAKEAGTPIQQKCDKCAVEEQTVQRKGNQRSGNDISAQLKSSKGNGSPMDKTTQSEMSSGFGADFSGVRIHNDANAVQMNRDLGSHAFTNENDIYFNAGKYNPSSEGGKHLLAHELTHTIQQGSHNTVVSRKEDPESDETTLIQSKAADIIIQKDEDPCAEPPEQGSQAEAAAAETAPTDPSCAVRNRAAEQPPEGQEEPDGEDTAREIEANEGGPLDERQSHAPPADENAPEDETGIQQDAQQSAEQPLDPCALREQQQAGAAGEAAGAGAAPVTNGLAPQQPATQAAGQAGNAAANTPASETNQAAGAEQQQQPEDFLSQRIQQGVSPLVQPQGLGEAASPELMEERDSKRLSAQEAEVTLASSGEQANALSAKGVQYQQPKRANARQISLHSDLSGKATAFLNSGVSQVHSILANGSVMASEVRAAVETNRTMLMADIDLKRQSVSGFFSQSRERANQKAALAKQTITGRHAATLLQIEMSALIANMQLQMVHQTKSQELQQTYAQQLEALGSAYTTGYNDLITAGNIKAEAVTTFANEKAAEYRRAEGASAEVRQLVVNEEADGFWDGYLTYNRYMARADSAKEVGKQYHDGMVSQAKAQADKMMCGQEKDGEFMGFIFQQGNEMLECSLLNAQDAVNRQKQAATMQATYNLQQMNSSIDQSLNATIAELNQKEAVQLQLINDYGIRQLMAIERDGEDAVAAALGGVNTAAGKLLSFLQNYQQTVQGSATPDAAAFHANQQKLRSRFTRAVAQAEQAVIATQQSALTAVNDSGAQVLNRLQQLYSDGIADAQMLMTSFEASVDGLIVSADTVFGQILQSSTQAISAEQLGGTNTINGVVTGVSGLITNIITGVGSKFTESKTAMETGMQNTIDNDLSVKICNEAEKAAEDVQPWWKTALKILLIIIVIVVVALVIGPAVIGAVGAAASALAGSLGAGAALAGTIGAWAGPIIGGAIVGALSGAVIQVGNNLIDIAGTNKALSWENVTKGVAGAMIAGAIGGALGGLGGQFAQVLMGRLGAGLGPTMQTLSKFGVESVFDVIGGALGDFAAGNPVTFESIVMGLAIGGAVQISMGGLSSIARNGVSTPHGGVDVNAPRLNPDGTPRTGLRSRIQDTARSIQDFQGRMMESGQNFGNRAGFGSNAPDVHTTRQGITDANARMEKGEFLPTSNQEAPNTRTGLDVDTPTGRNNTDENTTTRQNTEEGDGTNPRIESDSDTPTSRNNADENTTTRQNTEEGDGTTTRANGDGETLRTEDGAEVKSTHGGEGFETPTKDGNHRLKSDGDEPQMCSRCNDLEDIYHAEMDLPDPQNPGKTFRQTLDDLEALKNGGTLDILQYGSRVRDIQARLNAINPTAQRQALPTHHPDGTPMTPKELESQFWRDFRRRAAVYKTNEEMSQAYLNATYGESNVSSQVHLDVNVNGTSVRIIADHLVRLPSGKYLVVDAKYSSTHQITSSNARSTVTTNQSQAYPLIAGSGNPVPVTVRGTGGQKFSFFPGKTIDLDPRVLIIPNIHQGTAGTPVAGNLSQPFDFK